MLLIKRDLILSIVQCTVYNWICIRSHRNIYWYILLIIVISFLSTTDHLYVKQVTKMLPKSLAIIQNRINIFKQLIFFTYS